MHSFMTHPLITRHGPHDSDMLGQAAARQWSSPTVDNYDWTRRGPLQLMVLHTAVQWSLLRFAACVDRERSQDRPLTARVIARAASGCFCVSLERHGLNVDGPWHQIWTVQAL